jgi:hypothetical protein
VITFTSLVDPESVSETALHVLRDGRIFPVRAVVEGSSVTLAPTVLSGDRNDFAPPNDPPPNGLGFPANARFELEILGTGPLALRSRRDRALGADVRASFSTGEDFAPEQPPVAPTLAGVPAFNQTPLEAASGVEFDQRDPASAPTFDPRELRVSITFAEPMDPSTFDAFNSFSVTNVTPDFVDYGLKVPGRIVADDESRVFTFIPLFSLGDDPDSTEPFLFRVRLEGRLALDPRDARRITDLAGNPLEGNPDVDGHAGPLFEPIDFWFRTVDTPGLPQFGSFTEQFDDASNEDSSAGGAFGRLAVWGVEGLLRGAPSIRTLLEVAPIDTGFLMPEPLMPAGNHMQLLYFKNQDLAAIGPSTLIALEWGPRNNAPLAATYAGMTLTIGLSDRTIFNDGLNPMFARNFTAVPGNPVRVFQGDYTVPSGITADFFPWPSFQNAFEYDGTSSIVIDFEVPAGGSVSQAFRGRSDAALPRKRIVGPPGATTGTPPGRIRGHTTYHHRFTFVARRSFAASRLIDTQLDDPVYLDSVVVLGAEDVGMSYRLTFTGEDAIPGTDEPDGERVGPFEDIESIVGKRFFAFHFELIGSTESSAVPVVESLSVAWRIP